MGMTSWLQALSQLSVGLAYPSQSQKVKALGWILHEPAEGLASHHLNPDRCCQIYPGLPLDVVYLRMYASPLPCLPRKRTTYDLGADCCRRTLTTAMLHPLSISS